MQTVRRVTMAADNTSGQFLIQFVNNLLNNNANGCVVLTLTSPPTVALGSCNPITAKALWLYNSRGQFQSSVTSGARRYCLALPSSTSSSVTLDSCTASSLLNGWSFADKV